MPKGICIAPLDLRNLEKLKEIDNYFAEQGKKLNVAVLGNGGELSIGRLDKIVANEGGVIKRDLVVTISESGVLYDERLGIICYCSQNNRKLFFLSNGGENGWKYDTQSGAVNRYISPSLYRSSQETLRHTSNDMGKTLHDDEIRELHAIVILEHTYQN